MYSKLVLDTNVVLDWLVFDDPRVRLLRDEAMARSLALLTHPIAVAELKRVLDYPQLKLDASQRARVLELYAARATHAQMPPGFAADNLMLPADFPHCLDRDDDVFLALAYHSQADALITKDKALLKLRKQAAKHGVRIINLDEMNSMFASLQQNATT